MTKIIVPPFHSNQVTSNVPQHANCPTDDNQVTLNVPQHANGPCHLSADIFYWNIFCIHEIMYKNGLFEFFHLSLPSTIVAGCVWSEGLNWDFWTQIELARRMEIWLYPLNYRRWIDEIPQQHVQGRRRFFVAAGIGRKSKYLRRLNHVNLLTHGDQTNFSNSKSVCVRSHWASARRALLCLLAACVLKSRQHSNETNGKYEETCCIISPFWRQRRQQQQIFVCHVKRKNVFEHACICLFFYSVRAHGWRRWFSASQFRDFFSVLLLSLSFFKTRSQMWTVFRGKIEWT